jgi:hypothetical protein
MLKIQVFHHKNRTLKKQDKLIQNKLKIGRSINQFYKTSTRPRTKN